ncbi:MAG TPA: L-erythro-3,5-diaminohexanoate dehydrogenase [Myxococcota bacterium]|nr:L-erythro-3,5-diaminohexanoate dehydrogenase [Myxococcota bacterium]HQK51271.1 L-erythro-3,5-diaminohexanoate dehydrogenase [Myxococcota bacterium]
MSEYRNGGDRFGRHRVLAPEGALPQAATRLDNSLPIWDNEILIDVQTLNIDSASFRQMRTAAGGDPQGIANQVLQNVATMGKQQNPVTGSGGMLLGTVEDLGPRYSNPAGVKVGDRVCTLVSLTLTPLIIHRIREVHDSEQIDIEGKAVLFDSGVLARIPDDMNVKTCLALLDVAGAPPQAHRLAQKGQTIYIIGAGKSGILCAAAIRQKLGQDCRILVSATRQASIDAFRELGLADDLFTANALNPGETMDQVARVTGGSMADLVINTANVEGTELSSVLCCKQGGTVYFFNMATNFQKAALGAEGVGMDVQMIIGNGYAPGHADFTLEVYRRFPTVRKWFDDKFGG